MKDNMKLKKIFCVMLLAAAALGFQGCSDSDDAGIANITAPGTTISLSHDGTAIETLNLTMGELTSYMISVNTDGGWSVSMPDADTTWVHITPHAGYGWAVGDTAAINTRAYVKLKVDYNEGEPRSTVLTFATGSLTALLTINQSGRGSSSDPIETVWEMVSSLKMGYNLGNTLDASQDPALDWFNPTGPEDWRAYETCWGQPVTTQAMIDAIADKGFNIIRVPVTWFPHVDADWNINEQWMGRVQEVVDMVLATGSYCVLNVMHDTGARDMSRTDNQCWLTADPDKYEANTAAYQKLWKQIAERFRDYDDKLIFESFNEILDASYSWTAPSAGSAAYDVINKLQQDFVNTVRATGGNNLYRNLAVTTYSATGTSDAALEAFQVPQDQFSDHIYLSIHSYDPYNFCNNNSGKNPDGSDYDYNIKIFDDDCRANIDAVFARVSKRATNCGIPFIFGEFGAIDAEKSMAERVKYASYLREKFRANNTAGLWWMGLYDRVADSWIEQDIVDALMQ